LSACVLARGSGGPGRRRMPLGCDRGGHQVFQEPDEDLFA
jgi:hypothetical protein